jgi:teichoic acid transport system ATP-binding protein
MAPPDENGPNGDVTVAVSGLDMHYKVASSGPSQPHRSAQFHRKFLGLGQKVVVRALAGVSLVARHGETIGVVGTNGSGKSTLLRCIAGLEIPTRGRVVAESTPILLGVNAALMPELSGEDNIRLGCLAMGMKPTEMSDRIPEIIELSGIGDAVFLPMKTYSSGMAARLRFAIAASFRPDILLVDEALSTGDAAFKERSEQQVQSLREHAGTVFIVNHAAQVIEETCTRAIWLHRGRMVADGTASETAVQYRRWAWNIAKGNPEKAHLILRETVEAYTPPLIRTAMRPDRSAPRHAKRKS